jgi:hypothetical protein
MKGSKKGVIFFMKILQNSMIRIFKSIGNTNKLNGTPKY